jgi:hypothetical protein
MHRIIAIVMAEGSAQATKQVFEPKNFESAPHYLGDSVPRQYIVKREGDVLIKTYPPNVLVVKIERTVGNIFSKEGFLLREMMIEEAKKILKKRGANMKMSEEYALAVVDGYEGDPDLIVDEHRSQIAGFLKSEEQPLDDGEITHTLSTQMKYGKDDLLILDWDGAIVFDAAGEVDSVLQVLELANLQLLQYRILDDDLDHRLRRVEKLIREKAGSKFFFWNREVSRAMREVIRLRATSIVEFDALVRQIKLIGDWYSARLFELAGKKFRLDEWRISIKDKLDSLEDVYAIVAGNFSINKQYFVEFLLQLGWLSLLLVELFQIFR